MRPSASTLALGALLIGTGCGSASDDAHAIPIGVAESAPVEPAASIATDDELDAEQRVVAVSPLDLSTAVFDGTPAISVPFPYPAPDSAERALLGQGFDLVTWPERDLVRTSNVFLEGAPGDNDPLRVLFVPSTPLEDRWYALRSATAMSGPVAGAVRDRDGHWVARFRVGHQPIVQVARVTVDDEGNPEIRITYSERVRGTHDDIWRVEVEGAETMCGLVNADELASERGTTVVRLTCSRFSNGADVRLRPGAPLVTAVGGYPAVDADGGEQRAMEFQVHLPPREAAPTRSPTVGSPIPTVREVGRSSSRFGLDG